MAGWGTAFGRALLEGLEPLSENVLLVCALGTGCSGAPTW